jgi:hypothetical protein
MHLTAKALYLKHSTKVFNINLQWVLKQLIKQQELAAQTSK